MPILKKNLLFSFLLCVCGNVYADGSGSYTDPQPFSLMNEISQAGWHDSKDERWNVYGQATYISDWHSSFPAAYTNLNGTPNSLSNHSEHGFTATLTLFAGLKTWDGGEIYYVPEMIAMKPFSELKGVGGSIYNFELQKNGSATPIVYRSRLFFKQTFDLGGEKVHLESAPMQLDSTVDSRRLVFRFGNFSILDFFDKNSFAGDLRRQFTNMAFMTHAAYDFAADARGYTMGAVLEYFHDDWAVRFGHIAAPKEPNQLLLDFRFFKYYGQQLELEHRHTLFGQPGAVRILGYRNHENMGSWNDALTALRTNPNKNASTCQGFNYDNPNTGAPDLCWARKPNNKMGIGINLEQQLSDDIGLFFRGMYSDGKTEVYSYTSADSSISLGGLMKGERWGRNKDTFGIGYAQSWISKQHAAYLNAGGVDGFIGDGKLNHKPEQVVDVFYSFNVFDTAWITLDYQHLANPAYNGDRGAVDFYTIKTHVEF